MAFDIGPKIGIEGELEYKKALKEIEQGQRVMASELQKVSASFAGQENSIEALTARHDVLQRTLYGEEEKLDALRAALDNAANSFGESDKRTQEWQIKLNKAEAAAAKLRAQVVETEKAIKEANDRAPELERAEKYRQAVEGYQQTLSQVQRSGDVLSSEMEKISAQYAGNEKSAEALAARQRVLAEQYANAQKAVEANRAALEQAKQIYGESSEEAQRWQIALNKAEADQARLNQQMKQTTETGTGLGDTLDQLSSKFGVHLPSGITQSLNSMIRVDASSVALVGTMAAVATALVKVEGKLLDLSKAQAAAADDLATLSVKTGIATKTLQEYAYAAELLDVSVDTITGAQTKLIRSMDSARDGAAAQTAAFEKLGIQYTNTDGTLRNSETVFWEVVDALGQIRNGTERDAAAMDLLGKSAQDLNPLITAGSERMRELAAEAEKVGYVLSDRDVEALTTLDDAQQRAQKSNEALQKQIAVEFAPSATKAIETLTDVTRVFGKALVDSGAVEAFGYILESVVNIIAPLEEMDEAGNTLRTTFEGVAIVLAGVADLVQFIAGAAKMLGAFIVPGKGSWLSEGLTQSLNAMGYSFNGQSNYSQRFADSQYQRAAERSGDPTYYNGQFYGNADAALYARWLDEGAGMSFDYWKQTIGRNAAGTDTWRGGLTWVGEGGPELVDLPRDSRIYSAQESRDLAESPQPITIIVPGGVREMAQAVELMKAQRTESRRGAKVRR